ncbi:MAG: helix-turn-helix domain-containing protein [Clostridia bacterium]|nr:helix-turn-helix domain-containing protein [Clostridia bacterium]
MDKKILTAADQIDPVCEFRYNECIINDESLYLHCHDYYELIFIDNCAQKHYVNGKVFDAPENSLIFIRPDDYHDFCNDTGGKVIAHHIAFTTQMCHSLFDYLSPLFPSKELLEAKYPPYVILNSLDKKAFLKMIFSINTIEIEDKKRKNIAMRAILSQIFSRFFFDITSDENENIPLWLSDACTAMNKVSNFSEGMPRMVELSGRSKEHLCRSMRKHYNITASDFINDLRLTFVANRLLNSDMPIIDICYESGFSNLGWMYTLFKKKYGSSPSTFKKKNVVKLK